MTTWTDDEFMREGVLIVFFWLVGMFVAGLVLLHFSGALQNFFA